VSYFCWKCQSRYPTRVVWCVVCQDGGTVVVEPQRPQSQLRSQLQAASARDLIGRSWTLVESRAYPELSVSRGALVAVWGAAGGGKSTLATRFADGLAGAVVYMSAEEKLGPTVASRLQRCSVTRADFHVVAQANIDELVAFCRDVRAIALVIDSISMTSIRSEDLRRLVEASGVGVLVYLMHATNEGQAGGVTAWLHEADVVVEVSAMTWTVRKSRYQALDGTARPVLTR